MRTPTISASNTGPVRSRFVAGLLPATIGVAVAFLYQAGLQLPISAIVLLLGIVFAWGMARAVGISALAILPRWTLVLYTLPFLVLVENAFGFPDWGRGLPKIYELSNDTAVVGLVGTMALVGLCGLVSGIALAPSLLTTSIELDHSDRQLVGAPAMAFLFVACVPVFMLWLSVPAATIMNINYGELTSGASGARLDAGFSGLSYLAYVLLVACYLDIEFGQTTPRRGLKIAALAAAVIFATIFVNFLRGGRHISGLIVGLAALYLTRPHVIAADPRKAIWQMAKLGPILVAVMVVLIELDWIRGFYADGSYQLFDGISHWSYKEQTWMGAMFSSVGLADMYLSGDFTFRWGQTYLEYLLSLPPSVLANLIGYVRPIGAAGGGPSWWFEGTYTVGGSHPIVPAFGNFGILGVLGVLFLSGLVVGWIEAFAQRGNFRGRLYYGAAFVGSLHWFWYGDMYFIRALMGGLVADWLFYSLRRRRLVLPSLFGKRTQPALRHGVIAWSKTSGTR